MVVQAKSLFGRYDAGGTLGIARVPIPVLRNPLFLGPLAILLAILVGLVTIYSARLHAHRTQLSQLATSLNERVAERTAELVAINSDLEAFGHSLSHDLRGPLMSVTGFGAMLSEEVGGSLDDEHRHYLNRIVSQAKQMSGIVDGLSDLTAVAREATQQESVDLSALAQEIIGELRELEPDRSVEFTAESGLVASGNPNHMRLLMSNLLRNAWKFTAGRDPARIHFGAETDQDGRTVYCVLDNGVGFDSTAPDDPFEPFQRLHDEEDFAGTGLGLATVHRVVRKYGGEVWGESTADEGATFRFTL